MASRRRSPPSSRARRGSCASRRPPQAKHRRCDNSFYADLGLTIRPNPGGGNCLFASLRQALQEEGLPTSQRKALLNAHFREAIRLRMGCAMAPDGRVCQLRTEVGAELGEAIW